MTAPHALAEGTSLRGVLALRARRRGKEFYSIPIIPARKLPDVQGDAWGSRDEAGNPLLVLRLRIG